MNRVIFKLVHLCLSAVMFIALIFTGCAPSTSPEDTVTPAASPIKSPIAAASLAPSFTPIPTTVPEPTSAPIQTTIIPAPVQTTTEPAPSSTQDNGRVTLADGFYYVKLSVDIKERITGMSYPEDDNDLKITYNDLRYLRLKYYDFDGNVHDDGELIVNKKLADEVLEIFYELYQNKYPFTSINLVDDYGEPGDDNLSMAANNTSAFNYRYVTGTKTLSRHSYGAAIDINPMMNPYIVGDRVAPENGADYVDRSKKLPGMIDKDDLAYRLFTEHGWKWGGDNKNEKDYQHFSKNI